jgi:hypothetical protein
MATWILVGGCTALALILAGAVALILLLTRDGVGSGSGLPRFKRLDRHRHTDDPRQLPVTDR